ncbi:hypothetical protein SAMN05720762_103421 [Fibrobacter sp. UWH4]|nr:hypothetical protein SAMN05720762_103421 [Fibrobacter sp. UWH4]
MKKLFAFAMTSAMLIACGDDNSSSATEDISSSSEETILSSSAEKNESSSSQSQNTKDSFSNNQEENYSSSEAIASSSSINSSESQESSSSKENTTTPSVSIDFGEGYTYAMVYRYDETTGFFYQGLESCNYHSGTKTFAWEENALALDTNKITIVGDSMWTGPVKKMVSDDPNEQMFYDAYKNVETLSLSTEHNGIYGKWKATGCQRIIGETEIKCTASIGGLEGIARTITITQDSVYNTTVVDLSSTTGKEDKWNLGNILEYNLGFDIGDLIVDSLVKAQVIKVISASEISIGSQTFTRDGSAKFDKTGMNYYETFSSNGKTCTKHEQLGAISKEQCLEGNADFLLSARGDKEDSSYYYKEGPVEGFSLDNREEYYECTKSLVTEETKNILEPFARHYTD